MATIIRVGHTTCTLDWGGAHAWTCEGPRAKALQAQANHQLALFDPGGQDPNPPATHAQEVADLLGGEVVEFDELPFDPDVVY